MRNDAESEASQKRVDNGFHQFKGDPSFVINEFQRDVSFVRQSRFRIVYVRSDNGRVRRGERVHSLRDMLCKIGRRLVFSVIGDDGRIQRVHHRYGNEFFVLHRGEFRRFHLPRGVVFHEGLLHFVKYRLIFRKRSQLRRVQRGIFGRFSQFGKNERVQSRRIGGERRRIDVERSVIVRHFLDVLLVRFVKIRSRSRTVLSRHVPVVYVFRHEIVVITLCVRFEQYFKQRFVKRRLAVFGRLHFALQFRYIEPYRLVFTYGRRDLFRAVSFVHDDRSVVSQFVSVVSGFQPQRVFVRFGIEEFRYIVGNVNINTVIRSEVAVIIGVVIRRFFIALEKFFVPYEIFVRRLREGRHKVTLPSSVYFRRVVRSVLVLHKVRQHLLSVLFVEEHHFVGHDVLRFAVRIHHERLVPFRLETCRVDTSERVPYVGDTQQADAEVRKIDIRLVLLQINADDRFVRVSVRSRVSSRLQGRFVEKNDAQFAFENIRDVRRSANGKSERKPGHVARHGDEIIVIQSQRRRLQERSEAVDESARRFAVSEQSAEQRV